MLPERLVDGYRAFLGERFPRERSRFAALAEAGQRPEVMVIGCCDSRVSPEVIFDAGPVSKGDFITKWMTMIAPAAERLGPRRHDDDAYLGRLERAAIEQSLTN